MRNGIERIGLGNGKKRGKVNTTAPGIYVEYLIYENLGS